ncbi:MAG: transcription termination/antitermination protein NusG [Candidatus Sumerlaeota bacterium]|nr:transcription termination/antitermination protein NusG [Candidatus Sumerlaeota bacterium]
MGRNWYAVHTYSGFEKKVKANIEHRAAMEGYRDLVHEVVIPVEHLIEIKNGKKRTVERNLMPGYILVDIDEKDEVFDLVKKISGVSGFVGDSANPSPLSPDEVSRLLNIVEDKMEKPKAEMKFHKGERVKVIEGPFANFIGQVDAVDAEKSKLKVMVSIFGRPTAVELDVLQVEAV